MITLRTLPYATEQQVFDQVYLHLMQQGHKSYMTKNGDEHGCCAYRGHGGDKCAAGCLIGDREYNMDKMEGQLWSGLMEARLVPHAHWQLISELQAIHDQYNERCWLEQFTNLAKRRSLVVPPLPQPGTTPHAATPQSAPSACL